MVDFQYVSATEYPLEVGVDSQQQIRQSDLAFANGNFMWINGTQPVNTLNPVGGSRLPVPNSSFPFTRLASTRSADPSTTFLYHQISDTTLAEEQWDQSEGSWLPTVYITVSDS